MAGGTVTQWSHQASLEASPISASRARNFVTQHLVDHRLLYLVDPVRLVASELATNALLHAQTAFSVTLAATDQTVLLTVRDDSPALPTRRAAQAMDPSGRGLDIVRLVSHDWGTNEDGAGSKAVWASFAIRGPREF
jgi:anti-sigma regulatory factor (Ser/Thr protein kinase)